VKLAGNWKQGAFPRTWWSFPTSAERTVTIVAYANPTRKSQRYNLSDEQILEAARFAHENRYGSFVMQAGELESPAFTARVEHLLKDNQKLSGWKAGHHPLRLGEQEALKYTVALVRSRCPPLSAQH
jgi:hypothetical protein